MEQKKEMSMETRLLIFFVLMGLILLGTQYFYKPPPPKPAAPTAENTQPAPNPQTAGSPTNPPTPSQGAAQAPSSDLPGKIQADAEQTATVETSFYKVVFSNKGGVVTSWILKNYKDRDGKPLELVNPRALPKTPAPFATMLKGTPLDDKALFKMEQSYDRLAVNFEYSDGRTAVKKSFQFADKSYIVQINSEASQNGVLTPNSLAWRGGFGDQTVATAATDEHAVYYDSKLQVKDSKEAKNGPVSNTGQFNFEGVEDKYFAAVFLPVGSVSEVTVFSDAVANPAGADEQRAGAAFGGNGVNIGEMFVGPKDTDLLGTIDPKL